MTRKQDAWTRHIDKYGMGSDFNYHLIYSRIRDNERLQDLELLGFRRGQEQGKTLAVTVDTVYANLEKQWRDLTNAWHATPRDYAHIHRCLADLRNVAGCLFLNTEFYPDRSTTILDDRAAPPGHND